MASRRLARTLTSLSGWDYKVSSVVQKRNRCSAQESLCWKNSVSESAPESLCWKISVSESAPDSSVASKNFKLTPQQHRNEVFFGSFIWEKIKNLFPWKRSPDSKGELPSPDTEAGQTDSEGEKVEYDTADTEGDTTDSEGEKVEDDTADTEGDTAEKEEETACKKEDAEAGKGEEKNKAGDSGTSVRVTPQAKLVVKNMEAAEKIRKNVEKGDTMKKKAEEKLKPMRFVKMEVTQVED